MELRLLGKKYKITARRIGVILLTVMVITLGIWFSLSVKKYYIAIQNGETNPLLNQRLESSLSSAIANHNVTDADLRRLYRSGAPEIGQRDGLLTVVEFIDFGCPFCRASFEPVREMTVKYKDKVRLVIRDFPIEDLHPGATLAAHGARCAQEQGKFWAYHDKLFVNQNAFARAELDRYALEIGADTARFKQCMDEKRYMKSIEGDIADGLVAGVQGTPTFFFNGHRVQGALNAEALNIIVEQFLKPAPKNAKPVSTSTLEK